VANAPLGIALREDYSKPWLETGRQTMKQNGWNTVDEASGVLWREYSFGRGMATTLAFRAADGIAVVSPPRGLEPRDYDAIAELGEVRALVANNPLHNLGIAPWRSRFPDAKAYCPAPAVTSLEKKLPGTSFRPLSELQVGSGVQVLEMPGMPKGETLVTVKTQKGHVWFTGDVLTNFQALPPPPLRWLFTWTGSGPGFRLFKPNAWIFVKDAAVLRKWMEERLVETPPAVVVPAHGPAFEAADLPTLTKEQLERL
jgi:hypothetical protein